MLEINVSWCDTRKFMRYIVFNLKYFIEKISVQITFILLAFWIYYLNNKKYRKKFVEQWNIAII